MITQNVPQGKTSPGNKMALPAFEVPRAPGLDLYDLLPFRKIYFTSVSCPWTQPGRHRQSGSTQSQDPAMQQIPSRFRD